MIGESLLNLMGNEDPRIALMRTLGGQQQAAPVATPATPPQGGDTSAPGAGAPATVAPGAAGGAPGAPPQPRAYQSPQDLVSLYSQIQERERRAGSIDRGLMMIAAAGARPENRQALLSAGLSSGGSSGGSSSGGGGGGSSGFGNPLQFMQGVQQFQQNRLTQQQTAARRAALPQLAARYNLPIEAMTQLFDTGKLEDFIQNAEKPNRQTTALADGRVGIFELGGQQPRLIGTYGPETPITYSPQQTADGRIGAFNPRTGALGPGQGPASTRTQTDAAGRITTTAVDTGLPVGEPVGPASTRTQTDGRGRIQTVETIGGQPVGPAVGPEKPTTDQQNLETLNAQRAAAGQPPMNMEDYQKLNPRGTNVTVSPGQRQEDIEFAKRLGTEYDAAAAQHGTLRSVQQAQRSLSRGIVAGSAASPIELEARRAFGAVFGLTDDQITNTDEFLGATRGIVRGAVKDLGSGNGITDSDRKFIEQQVGATNTLGPDSLRRLLVMQELKSREAIERYNTEAERARTGNPNSRVRIVEMPAPSEDLVRRVPATAIERARTELSRVTTPQERDMLRREFNTMYGSGMFEHIMGSR